MFILRIITFIISTITAYIMLNFMFTGNLTGFIITGIILIIELIIFDLRRIYIRDKITDNLYKNSKRQ